MNELRDKAISVLESLVRDGRHEYAAAAVDAIVALARAGCFVPAPHRPSDAPGTRTMATGERVAEYARMTSALEDIRKLLVDSGTDNTSMALTRAAIGAVVDRGLRRDAPDAVCRECGGAGGLHNEPCRRTIGGS